MVEFAKELEKMTPIKINAIEFNHYRIQKNIRSSIVLYNQSILNLKMNDIPLAVTNLKQALSLNPGFCEAIKLLGLSYASGKDFKNAEKYFKKLAKYPLYNALANDYLKELHVEKTASQAVEAIRSANIGTTQEDDISAVHRYMSSNNRTTINAKKYILPSVVLLLMVTGIVSAYLVRFDFLTMFVRAEKSKSVTSSPIKSDTKIVKDKVAEEKYSKLDKDYKELQKNLETAKSQLDTYKSKYEILQNIVNAERAHENGDDEDAAEKLLMLKNSSLDDSTKVRFDKLWTEISSRAVWPIYNKGSSLYKQGLYQEALPKLKIAQGFVSDQKLMPWILYQIGVCYRETKDDKNALIYFQTVKDNYPNTEYAAYSVNSISQMKK